jgi:hypothetical protein
VTEAEWLAATDPWPMLEFLSGRASDRKLRLFACACCRRIWHLFLHSDSFKSIEIAEQFAEGEATDGELRMAGELAMWAGDDASWRSMQEAVCAWTAAAPARRNGHSAALSTVHDIQEVFAENESKCEEERVAQCILLREIFANPFRPAPAVDPAWLAWQGGVVGRLARAAYEERRLPEGTLDPARLALVADALEDAGCADAELLGHLRSAGPHVRGCRAVDLMTGRN